MFVSPMLLQKSDHPFNDESYITELKLDGIRLILSKWDDKIKLYTRHNNEVTSRFPELTNLNVPNGTVLDGEIVISDENGKPDFEAVMERFMSSKITTPVEYIVFDVLYINGKKTTPLPILERKEKLTSILPNHPQVTQVKWLKGYASDYFKLVKQNELEGIVMKKVDNSPYRIGKRSDDWLKVINYQYSDVLITGMRKQEFGLLLSFLDGSNAGLMEFMTVKERRNFYRIMKSKNETDKFHFIEPIKCKVKYRNLTKSGKLRIPSFVEWK